MAPDAASGVSAGAGWLSGKHQPHALRGEDGGLWGGEQGPPSLQPAAPQGQCLAAGHGDRMRMVPVPSLDPQTPPVPPMSHPMVPSKPPQSQLSWEGEWRGAARRGAHRPGARLGTARPRGAVGRGAAVGLVGAMRRLKKFSS